MLCHELLCSYLLHSKHSPFRFPAFQAFTPEADDLRVGRLLVGAVALHATELLQRVPATATPSWPCAVQGPMLLDARVMTVWAEQVFYALMLRGGCRSVVCCIWCSRPGVCLILRRRAQSLSMSSQGGSPQCMQELELSRLVMAACRTLTLRTMAQCTLLINTGKVPH